MPENKFKRYRVDLKDDDAEYFDKMAEEMGVKPQTLLRMTLSYAAKNKISFHPGQNR